MILSPNSHTRHRCAVATVELALLMPFLVFLFVIAVDYGRIFYFSQIVANCARNGAIYVGDPTNALISPYANVTEAAKADAGEDMKSQLQVTQASGPDGIGTYVEVTVVYPFKTLTKYP